VLYRPYHLVALEMPIAIAHAVIRHEAWLAPLARPVADVTTVAKRDLKAGEMLDGCGGYTVHGMIDLAEVSLQEGYLPLGLAEDIRATRDLKRGDPLTYDSVELDESSLLVSLRREQDDLMRAGGKMA
jgi:predicted homoserine dehydrogenase-like protein